MLSTEFNQLYPVGSEIEVNGRVYTVRAPAYESVICDETMVPVREALFPIALCLLLPWTDD